MTTRRALVLIAGAVTEIAVADALAATTFIGALTGNASSATLAASATVLATARAINGVNFDGSAPITVADATRVLKAGDSMTGALYITSAAAQALGLLSGSATTSVALGLGRTTISTSIAIVGATNNFINGSAVDDLILKSAGKILVSTANSANAALRIDATGSCTFTNSASIDPGGTNNAGFEIGSTGGASLSYLDFHSGATAVDFDSRILSSGGTGSSGFGTLTLSSGALYFNTGNTQRVLIDAVGNVGIGNTPPAWGLGVALTVGPAGGASLQGNAAVARLTANTYFNGANWVRTTAAEVSTYTQAAGSHLFYSDVTGAAGSTYTPTERMRLDANGKLGIGTATINASGLEIVAATNTLVLRQTSASGYAGLRIYNDQNSSVRALEIDYMGSTYSGGEAGNISCTGAYPLILSTNNTERVRIDAAGTVSIGVSGSNPAATLSLNGASQTRPTIRFNSGGTTLWNTSLKGDAAQNWYFISNPSETVGVYMTPAASGWNNLSDERAKSHWQELGRAVDGVLKLRAGTFAWKKDPTLPRDVGLIAQDLLDVLPEAVDTTDPESLGVRYTHVVPLLVKAIQELHGRLRTVETIH